MERPRSLLTKVCDLCLFVWNIWEEKVSCQVGHFECGDSQKFYAKAWQFHTTVAPAAVTTCPSSNLSKEKHSQLSVCKCLLFVRYVGPPFALLYLLGGTITITGSGFYCLNEVCLKKSFHDRFYHLQSSLESSKVPAVQYDFPSSQPMPAGFTIWLALHGTSSFSKKAPMN